MPRPNPMEIVRIGWSDMAYAGATDPTPWENADEEGIHLHPPSAHPCPRQSRPGRRASGGGGKRGRGTFGRAGMRAGRSLTFSTASTRRCAAASVRASCATASPPAWRARARSCFWRRPTTDCPPEPRRRGYYCPISLRVVSCCVGHRAVHLFAQQDRTFWEQGCLRLSRCPPGSGKTGFASRPLAIWQSGNLARLCCSASFCCTTSPACCTASDSTLLESGDPTFQGI